MWLYNESILLPSLQRRRVSDQHSRTVIGRIRHVTTPIWSRIDWLTGSKIRILGLSFAELEVDKTVYLEFVCSCLGAVNINFYRIFQFYDS